ncbi:hypothetical protein E5288_WYG019623 [Bos mutus]|uniref:Uncharacterized protein n=1 Tax=Bos mutus TaxID=72004 RepID=A0A6B0RT94_9CETA|nr:hypothetical protein [Bos mutus]
MKMKSSRELCELSSWNSSDTEVIINTGLSYHGSDTKPAGGNLEPEVSDFGFPPPGICPGMDGAHVVISSKKQRNVGPAAAALQGEGLSVKGTMSHVRKGKGPDS